MSMKDSKIDWIGQMPEDWELIKIGSIFRCRNEKVNDTDYPPLSVTRNGIVPQMENVAKTDANDNRKMVKVNDFVINSRSDRKQSCGVSDLEGSVSLINTVLFTENTDVIIPEFTNLILKNYGFAEEFYRWGHGIVADLWTTRWQEMKSIVLPIPYIDIQSRIVRVLNKTIANIETLIANQQAQIEKLKEYKQAVITETVTKGLDKTAPMKDSFCWQLPKIPMKWKIHKLLYMLAIPITDGPHETPELLIDGIPFVSADSIKNEKIDFSRKRGYISYEYNELISQKYKPQKHDIYMIKSGATTGKVAFVDTDIIFNIWSPLAAIRVNENFYWKYVFYVLQSNYFQKQVRLGWSFGTQQNLSMRVLEQLLIAYPNKVEQQQIADYLDKKCADVDNLISIKQQKIEKLQEYKKSLIYEYVTGKKEVV